MGQLKPKTPEQMDKETNARLLRTYGISLDEYKEMLEQQNGGCAICGRPPGDKRLHVDHDHRFDRVKLKSVKTELGWKTTTPENFVPWVSAYGKTKSIALKTVRQQLRRLSIRGLLDWKCNVAIQKFQDNPNKLEAAAVYIRRFHAKHAPIGA